MKAASYVTSIALLVSALSVVECSGGGEVQNPPPPASCVPDLMVNCELLYNPPIYATIYRELIQPQCAIGSSCHSTDGAMGGLVLANADDTYDALLGTKGGTKRILPGYPECSPLMVRLESRDPNFQMPRGSRLSEPALCDFVQWIKQGALKN
jgi:hypothetical protein